jgi:hypothetical protein
MGKIKEERNLEGIPAINYVYNQVIILSGEELMKKFELVAEKTLKWRNESIEKWIVGNRNKEKK